MGHWRPGLEIADGKGYILFFQKCQEMKGEVGNKQKKKCEIWNEKAWGQVCFRCSQSSSLSKKKGQPRNIWGEDLISVGGVLKKWTHSEQPPWRVEVVNLDRTRSGPQAWPLTQGPLPRFLEDKLRTRVFLPAIPPPHMQRTVTPEFIPCWEWANQQEQTFEGQRMQLLLSGVADSESFQAGKEAERIRAGLNCPGQTSNRENLPSFILSLIF